MSRRAEPPHGKPDDDDRLLRVVALIRATLHETPDYPRLARLAGLSYCQLFRLFKARFALSPQQYIEQQRIAYAKHLLLMNHLSVKEVAVRAGFTNQLYFSRRFQKATGQAPTQYRASLVADPERPLHPYSYDMGLYTTPHTYGSFA